MEEKETEKTIWKSKLPHVKRFTLKEIGLPKLLIMLLAGIFLLVLSFPDFFSGGSKKTNSLGEGGTKQAAENSTQAKGTDLDEYVEKLETRLQNILKKVEGIGEVEVMLTLESSKEQVTLKDAPYSQESTTETDSAGGSRITSNIQREDSSVMVQSENGEEIPYVTKEIEPSIEGVIIIAEGGGNTVVMNEIIGAIEALFDVPTHKIKVMKMNVSGTSK